MNKRLKHSLSLAILTLTLMNAGLPVTSALANGVTRDAATNVATVPNGSEVANNGEHKPVVPTQPNNGQNSGSSASGNGGVKPNVVPGKPNAKPKLPYDPNDLPTSLPKTFDVPEEPATGAPGARLKLSDASSNNNTRDLGGYVTADGKWKIKTNRLLRSANLSKFTAEDIKVLQSHDVKHVVDMRTAGQIKGREDKQIPQATWENISILGKFANAGLNTNASGDFEDAKENKPGDAGFYNHQLEFSYSAMTGYKKFLDGLLTQRGATLFHCSSGKDRTGIASVLIMSALGMDTSTIAKDFMLSERYQHHVQYSWLREYYREINSYYKNMPSYLVNGLGFTKYQQEVLKSKYLVSNDKEERAYPAPKAPSRPNVTIPSTSVDSEVNKAVTKPDAVQSSKPEHKPTVKTKHKRVRIKVISVKRLKHAQMVHLKKHRPYFYDMHLKYKVGLTKDSKIKWRLIKRVKLRIGHKKKTYVQIVSPHGYHRWIQSNAVSKIKR
ncbi:tyrosine-protein phosphatase [Levilactobacillus brevis]|nr:tyrosine-protein phosphatase [Levilactobacillus brevis]